MQRYGIYHMGLGNSPGGAGFQTAGAGTTGGRCGGLAQGGRGRVVKISHQKKTQEPYCRVIKLPFFATQPNPACWAQNLSCTGPVINVVAHRVLLSWQLGDFLKPGCQSLQASLQERPMNNPVPSHSEEILPVGQGGRNGRGGV